MVGNYQGIGSVSDDNNDYNDYIDVQASRRHLNQAVREKTGIHSAKEHSLKRDKDENQYENAH